MESSDNIIQKLAEGNLGGSVRPGPTPEQASAFRRLRTDVVNEAFKDPSPDDKDAPIVTGLVDIINRYYDLVDGQSASPLVGRMSQAFSAGIVTAEETLLDLAVLRQPSVAGLWDQGLDAIINHGR